MDTLKTSAIRPPSGLGPDDPSTFEPDHDLWRWCRETFLGTGRLRNPDHEHLGAAEVAFLWTNVENTSKGRTVIGECQLGQPSGKAWPKGRQELQIEEWFGSIPDFLITLYAPFFAAASEAECCAVLEHELYHAYYVTKDGQPVFSGETGDLQWYVRGHDIEEFMGVARRYGAVSPELREIRDALNAEPILPGVWIRAACGSCRRAA